MLVFSSWHHERLQYSFIVFLYPLSIKFSSCLMLQVFSSHNVAKVFYWSFCDGSEELPLRLSRFKIIRSVILVVEGIFYIRL